MIEKFFSDYHSDLTKNKNIIIQAFEKQLAISNNDEMDALSKFAYRLSLLGFQNEADEIYKFLIFKKNYIKRGVYESFLINILMCFNLEERSKTFYKYAKEYGKYFKPSLKLKFHSKIYSILGKFKKRKSKKINIAYTCHFFGADTSQKLYNPVITNHDKNKFNIFIYSDNRQNYDESKLKEVAHKYVNTAKMEVEEFVKLLVDDQIDILVENNGYGSNRYLEISLGVVPTALTFFNCPHTTAIKNMNYIISSKYINLEKVKKFYSEKIIYLKDTIHAVEFPYRVPDIKLPTPYERNNHITFCSFGSLGKLSKELIAVFCEIMKKVPGSKILLKYPNYFDDLIDANRIWVNHFIENGIEPDRVIIIGSVDNYYELYNLYNEVDIALDTFPYTAGTTTIDALYMGVPVITKYNQDYDGQHSVSTLKTIGHEELLTDTIESYIAKAVNLAHDKEKLLFYKTNLRDHIKNSSQCDVRLYTKNIEDIFLKVARHGLIKRFFNCLT